MALCFAALSAHSLKVSPQCKEIKQKVTSVPFISKQWTRYFISHIMSDLTLLFVEFNEYFRTYKYEDACMCFSAINGSGPAYLSELLHVYTLSRTLRSSFDTCMLEIQQYKCKTHGFRTFSCFGPYIWNSLPQDLRHCKTLSSFKAKLKTFLFSQYFDPN